MGKRGPRPTPTSVLKLHGSREVERRGPETSPDPTCPACPDWLDDEARDRWALLAPELHRLGLLTSVDGDVLAVYCQAVAELQLATETLRREGRVITCPDGKPRPHPGARFSEPMAVVAGLIQGG